MAKEGVEPFQVGILVGDDLAQERVEVAEGEQFAAPKLGLVFVLRARL